MLTGFYKVFYLSYRGMDIYGAYFDKKFFIFLHSPVVELDEEGKEMKLKDKIVSAFK